jgi:alcohol dehydrogenase
MLSPKEPVPSALSFSSPFDFQLRTQVVFGVGRIDELGAIAGQRGAKRVLVVSDPGIIKAGHVQRGQDSLTNAGLESVLFSEAHENPTTRNVEDGLGMAKDFQPDLIVGLGGGSSMDCAKGINFLHTNGGKMQDYWGVGKAEKPMLPFVAVPTTAGTGSELQSFALISDEETHVKMACGDKKATAFCAILDPGLTLTQPNSVTALTGIDAISHAVETMVTTRRTPASMTFSRQSFQWLAGNFHRVLQEPGNIEARGGVQFAASMAGLAIENSMLGAAHALANPLTANYDVPHGQAVGMMLPYVVQFNSRAMADSYLELERFLPNDLLGENPGDRLAEWIQQTLRMTGLVTRLSELGVAAGKLPQLAAEANQQWTKGFNPVAVGESELFSLYQAAF